MFKEQQTLLLYSILRLLRTRPNLLRNSAADLKLRTFFLKDLLAFVCELNDIGLNIKTALSAPGHDEAVFFIIDVNCFSNVSTGSWTLQFESAGEVCILRSLLWPGLTLYHVLMTSQHGYIYIGSGTRNLDLPFML